MSILRRFYLIIRFDPSIQPFEQYSTRLGDVNACLRKNLRSGRQPVRSSGCRRFAASAGFFDCHAIQDGRRPPCRSKISTRERREVELPGLLGATVCRRIHDQRLVIVFEARPTLPVLVLGFPVFSVRFGTDTANPRSLGRARPTGRRACLGMSRSARIPKLSKGGQRPPGPSALVSSIGKLTREPILACPGIFKANRGRSHDTNVHRGVSRNSGSQALPEVRYPGMFPARG